MCSCCQGLRALFSKQKNHQQERENFERIVAFLGQVPLFKTQLPDAELPKVAKHLVMKTWPRGAVVVKQGDMGECFWLILSGEVKAITTDENGRQTERCRLSAGDYWGGQSLINQRNNVADIVSCGQDKLVTLSMSRNHFEQLGFMTKLVFPKRPRLHRNPTRDDIQGGYSNPDIARTEREQKFILESINRSPNLRALLSDADREMSGLLAQRAERRELEEDAIVARCGEFGEAFFIIESGSIDVLMQTKDLKTPRSAETAIASSTMAERLMRKQHFLQELHRKSVLSPKSESHMVSNSKSLGLDAFSQRERHSLTHSVEEFKRERTRSFKKSGTVSFIDRQHINVGDHVALAQEEGAVGEVLGVSPSGLCDVLVGGSLRDIRQIDADLLRPILAPHIIARLEAGDTFGELSLIYNVRTEATFKAHADSVVYVIHGKAFKEAFKRRVSREEEYVSLLDEVHILSPFLRTERIELARQAVGFVECKPYERVLTQDIPREEKLWYVIHRGYGLIYTNEDSSQKVFLERASHFGERSLLRGADAADVNVDAGPQGMVCLVFNGETIKQWLQNIWSAGTDMGSESGLQELMKPTVDRNVGDWLAWKGKNQKATVRVDAQLDDLVKVEVLGFGGFADVFLARDDRNGKSYALKRISKGFVQSLGQEVANVVVWERDLMFKVDSPFIVHLYTTFKDREYVYFLSEAVLGGNLLEMVQHRSEIFSEDEPRGSNTAFYVACLIAGLEHLHERCIVYRDMKPENVLIDEVGYAKICDMGFARYVLEKTNTMCGTPEYMPPEQIDFPHWHSHSADWWSLGVLTYELIVGQTPWDDEGICDKRERLLAIRRSQERNQVSWPFACPKVGREFVEKLLKKLPHRLGAEGGAPVIREDAWFKRLNFDFDALQRRALPSPFVPERSEKLDLFEEVEDSIRTSIFVPYRMPSQGDPESSWTQYF